MSVFDPDELEAVYLSDEALDLDSQLTPSEAVPERPPPTTALITRNAYDEAKFVEMQEQTERLYGAIYRNKDRYALTEAVAADSFHALRLPFPQQQEVSAEYQKAATAIKAMLESPDYYQLHQLTQYDALLSADAAAGVTEMLVEAILKEEEQQRKQAEEEERQARQERRQQRQKGQGMPGAGQPGAGEGAKGAGSMPGGPGTQQQASGAHQSGQQTGQPSPAEQSALARAEQFEQAMHRAVRRGLKRVLRSIEGEAEALGFFSGDSELGSQSYALDAAQQYGRTGDIKKRMALAKQLMNNVFLRAIFQNLGRHERIARNAQMRKIDKPVDELAGVTYGRDLARLTPASLAMLAIPEYQVLFMKDYAVGRLQQFQLCGKERVNRGPVIVAIDTSGSMKGQKLEWAMTVLLTLIGVARRQERDLVCLNFSSTVYSPEAGGEIAALREDVFKQGQSDPDALLDCVTFAWNGGTLYQPWMERMIELVNSSEYDKADGLLLTDGSAAIDPQVQEQLNQVRKARGFKVVTTLFGNTTWADRQRVEAFSDEVFHLIDFQRDVEVLEHLYSI
jgi:uncharacterized protein with von Willebrand factor type A (vWA) domain